MLEQTKSALVVDHQYIVGAQEICPYRTNASGDNALAKSRSVNSRCSKTALGKRASGWSRDRHTAGRCPTVERPRNRRLRARRSPRCPCDSPYATTTFPGRRPVIAGIFAPTGFDVHSSATRTATWDELTGDRPSSRKRRAIDRTRVSSVQKCLVLPLRLRVSRAMWRRAGAESDIARGNLGVSRKRGNACSAGISRNSVFAWCHVPSRITS